MIKYDHSKLTIEYSMVKSITTALGGSMRVRVEENEYERVEIPFAVARRFKARHKTTKYITDVYCAVVKYDGRVVAVERARDNNQSKDDFQCVSRIHSVVGPLVAENDFLTDGTMIYRYKQDSEPTTLSANFETVECVGIMFADLTNDGHVDVTDRTAVRFQCGGKTVTTPPIWKNILDVGQTKLLNDSELNHFDHLNDSVAVNLSFVLYAGQTVTEHYTMEEIECLRLPELMVALNTVNLPSVSPSIKAVYDTKMGFTNTMSWLMGLLDRAVTFEQFEACSALMKYLTSKGIFRKNIIDVNSIFRTGERVDIPLIGIDTLREKVGQKSLHEFNNVATQLK